VGQGQAATISSSTGVVSPYAQQVRFTQEAFDNGLLSAIDSQYNSQFRALAEQLLESHVSQGVIANALMPLKYAAMAPAPSELQAQQGDACNEGVSGKALNRWAKAVLHTTKGHKINDCNRATALALIDETRALVDEALRNPCMDHHWRLGRKTKKLAKRAKYLERGATVTQAAPVKAGPFKSFKDTCVGLFKGKGAVQQG
jgi:hypothetical protein